MQTPEPEGNRESISAFPTLGARTRPQHGGAGALGTRDTEEGEGTPPTADPGHRLPDALGGTEWHRGRGL